MALIGVQKTTKSEFIDFSSIEIVSTGSVGPYTLPSIPRSGKWSKSGLADNIDVWVNGVFKASNTYTVSGTNLTLNSAPTAGQIILVKFKNQAVAAGNVSSLSVGTSEFADNAVVVSKLTGLANGKIVGYTPTGAPGEITNLTLNENNIYNLTMNTFKIARNNGLSVQKMDDGIADEYVDETGIDTVTSTLETYNAGGHYYTNTAGAAMVLVSNANVSNVVDPSVAYLIIAHQFITAGTLNTDFTAEVSRDNGTTWELAVLEVQATNTQAADINIVTATLDLSGQPAGTNMKYRLKTLNTIEQRVHACSLQWRA